MNPYGTRTDYMNGSTSINNRVPNNFEQHYWVGHQETSTTAQDGTAINADVVVDDPWVDPGTSGTNPPHINMSLSTVFIAYNDLYTQEGWLKYNLSSPQIFTEQGQEHIWFERHLFNYPAVGTTQTFQLQHDLSAGWDSYFTNGALIFQRISLWTGIVPMTYQFMSETSSISDEMPGAAGGEQWHNMGVFTSNPWQWNPPKDRSVYTAGQTLMPDRIPLYFGASMTDPYDATHMWSWDYACSY